MGYPFYTIGHGTRSIDEFVDLLRSVEVAVLADVRTVPRSRRNPQYNLDALPRSLAPSGIDYEHIAALGGLRRREPTVPLEVNAFWENESFHNYADYAMSAGFREGLAHLRALGRRQRSAVMCAETVWWRCHRRIITDYLLASGETVFHILAPGHVALANMNEAARVQADGSLVYSAAPVR